MTSEEAQKLLSEIKRQNENNWQLIDWKCLEKIINRFANKPPYKSSCANGHISLNANYNKTAAIIFSCWDKGSDFSINELKQLRDNCDKMLEHLDEK